MESLKNPRVIRPVLFSVALCTIAFIALCTLIYLKRSTIPDMDIAAWGAFLAGVAGVFAFILIGAGFWLQKSALQAQQDALARLALALESQSEALMASHAPAFESSTLVVADHRTSPEGKMADRIELTLINTGGIARDLVVALCGMESLPPAHRVPDDEYKVQRHPNLIQGNPPWISSWFYYREHGEPPDSRPHGFLVALYRDAYGIQHRLNFEVRWHRSPYTDPPFSPSKYGNLVRVSTSVEGYATAERIDLDQPSAVRDWASKFGVSVDELRKAVEGVGSEASKVGEYLRMARGIDP